MHRGLDASRRQLRDHVVPLDRRLFVLDAHHEEVPGPVVRFIEAGKNDVLFVSQVGEIALHHARPAIVEFVQPLQLAAAQRGGQVRQVVLEPELRDVVAPGAASRVAVPAVLGDAVHREHSDAFAQGLVVGGQRAAFAGRHVLRRIEAESRGVAHAANAPVAVVAAHRMSRVGQHLQVVTLGDVEDRIHLARLTGEVHGDDDLRSRRNRPLDRLGVDVRV